MVEDGTASAPQSEILPKEKPGHEDIDDIKEVQQTDPLQVGDRCIVTWRDGNKKLATIVERRPSNYRKRAHSGKNKENNVDTTGGSASENDQQQGKSSPNDLSNLKAHEIDYYVHYLNHDRRLDEWLKIDKFDLDTIDRTNKPDAETHDTPSRRSRRDKRRKSNAFPNESSSTQANNSADQSLAALEKEHEEITKVKNISKIIIGPWEVEAWYFSPYPEEYSQEDTLRVCEFCLKYMKYKKTHRKHMAECASRRPPGNEIYREGNISVYEVDGKEHRIYCQNLCLLAKLFLDHKTLYYDVEPFYFYIITEVDEYGAHIVGYFSKEKVSAEDYNLACILTFPQYQRSGYGKFIISLSYELSKRERKAGSPEKPLSDLGKISYRSYWTHVLMTLLSENPGRKSLGIRHISEITAIKTEDIISTLQSLNMIKFWKGQHVVHVKEEVVQDYMKQKKRIRLCKSEFLVWEPKSKKKNIEGSQN